MRKLTHEEFIEKFKKQNTHAQDIEVLGTYKNANTKILCKCKICEHEWEPRPDDLLHGHGCSKCGGTGKLTHEEFMEKFNKQNKHAHDIEIMGTYINAKTKIKCKCKIDEYEWETIPSRLLQGGGCPKCGGTKKLTHEEFITRLQQINANIEIIGTYVNSSTKILCRCKIDRCEWEARPTDLLQGHGCPQCMKITHDKFIQRFNEVNPYANDIEILGTYKGALNKIKCRCKIDGCEWEANPSNLLKGTGCPKCGEKRTAQKQAKTHEQFMEELQQINPNIEILGTYKNALNKIKCRCKVCEHEWEAQPRNLLNGIGCPKCNISKGEKRVAQYLDNLGITYIYNKKYFKDLVGTGGGLLKPDFVIPSLKIWIEYDGEQHFKPVNFTGAMSAEEVQQLFEYAQQNDQIKDQYAKDNNWTLVRIPFTEYDNIEQILANYIM